MDRRVALHKAAYAYLGFAFKQPKLYQAIFTVPTRLRFADGGSEIGVKSCFRGTCSSCYTLKVSDKVAVETFWMALCELV